MLTLQPHSLAERNEYAALCTQGLLVDIGCGYVPWDIASTMHYRCAALAPFITTADIVDTYTALWIHTGVITPRLASGPCVTRAGVRRFAPRREWIRIGSLNVTSLEQTAVDLLKDDPVAGVGHMFELIRAGARFSQIRGHFHATIGAAHTKQAREYLDHIPRHVIDDLTRIAKSAEPAR